MMNRTKNKYISILLCFVVTLLTVTPSFTAYAADTITLKTADDYIKLAKNCKTD